MKNERQDWIFSVRYAPEGERDFRRWAVVGPASTSTVEAALHLAGIPEVIRAEIRSEPTVRNFVDARLDHECTGYYIHTRCLAWLVCIGPVHEVLK